MVVKDILFAILFLVFLDIKSLRLVLVPILSGLDNVRPVLTGLLVEPNTLWLLFTGFVHIQRTGTSRSARSAGASQSC